MCDLENVGQGHNVQQSQWRHSTANLPRLPIDDNSNVCSISHSLCNIRKYKKMSKILPWKWRCRSRSRKLYSRRPTRNVRFHTSDLFQNFSYPGIDVYTRKVTHTHTYSERPRWRLFKNILYLFYKQICFKMVAPDRQNNIHQRKAQESVPSVSISAIDGRQTKQHRRELRETKQQNT